MKRLILLFAILLGACQPKSDDVVLRVGLNTWPGYEYIYLAKVKGFYEAQGVKVELVELNSLGDVRRAFERKQIDVMASTLVEVLTASETTQQKIKIIAVTDASKGADTLLVRKDGPIKTISDLKGKSVGMEGATVDVQIASLALATGGLTLSDVHVVAASQDDLVSDIQNEKLDAIETYPPYSIKLLDTGNFVSIFDTSRIPNQIFDVLSVADTFYQAHPAALNKFLQAYFQSVDYYFANKDEAAAIMGKREGISAQEFNDAVAGMSVFRQSDQALLLNKEHLNPSIKNAADALLKTGWLKSAVNPEDFNTK